MAPRSKLKVSLAAAKGLTDKKVKQIKDKKKHKAAVKEKRKKGLIPQEKEESDEQHLAEENDDWEREEEGLCDIEAEESNAEDDDGDKDGYTGGMSAAALLNNSDSDSESDVDMAEKLQGTSGPKSILKKTDTDSKQSNGANDSQDDMQGEEDDSEIALDDLDDLSEEDREDLLTKNRLSINNQPALLAAAKRTAIPKDATTPFVTHLTIVSPESTASKIVDISDDLSRELQLYGQSLEAAQRARALLRAEAAPFSRPKDYFAEMVKDDGHMENVKAKLVEEATAKKAAAEARKLRDLKKFGKQVQVAKLQERQKVKRETLDKIKALKKKRSESGGNAETNEADLFDVALDDELSKPGKRSRGPDQGGGKAPNAKRTRKDAKFGFGGKKRHGKSGDALSSGDLSSFSAKRMKSKGGGAPGPSRPPKTARLGKSKRKAMAAKRR